MSVQEPTNYNKMSLKQLKTLLKSMKVKGVSRLNKKQMISLLNQRETEQKTTEEPVKESTLEPVKEQKPVEKMSLTELKNICRENKIKGFSKMKKNVIVALLTPLFFAEPKEEKEYVHLVFAENDDIAESRDYLNTMTLKTLRALSKKYKLKKYSKLNRKDIISLIENRTLVTADDKIRMKLKKYDLKKLKSICKTIKFKGYSKLNKKNIINGIMSMNK